MAEFSDKSHPDGHDYAPFYEKMLGSFESLKILEIGSGSSSAMGHIGTDYKGGASARAFRNCFGAEIVTVDLNPEASEVYQGSGITAVTLNAYTDEGEATLAAFGMFDVAIDDGSHQIADQLNFVRRYRKFIRSGGLLIVEDVPDFHGDLLLAAFGGNIHEAKIESRFDDRIWWIRV